MTFNEIKIKLSQYIDRERDGSLQCRCPAHDDDKASLSVSVADDKVLLHCFAGCTTENILKSVGMTARDLFTDNGSITNGHRANGHYTNGSSANGHRNSQPDPVVATYDYIGADGVLRFQVQRRKSKQFIQRRPNGNGGWVYKVDQSSKVLYRLPELLASGDRWVLIPEGEKDVNNLAGAGYVSTTNAGGASAPWLDGYTESLRGRRVCILPDNDEPGRQHAFDVANHLVGIASDVRILELPNLPAKGDVSDWLEAGGDPILLRSMVEAAPAYSKPVQPDYDGLSEPVAPGPANFLELAELGNIDEAPPLPAIAQLSESELELAATTGGFLNEYIEFASKAAPMTPGIFHLSAGLSLLATAVARRIHLRVNTTKIYPNLYILYCGPSTLEKKTTGMNVATNLMEATGMDKAFRLPERQTPEAFVSDTTTALPSTFSKWTPATRERWLAQRSIAAQRAWFMDEASHLLDSFNRDYTSGLLPLVLDMYDSKDSTGGRNTKNYGLEYIEKSYLTIFGATTHASMSKHMQNSSHWHNGLFARFSLVVSDQDVGWEFWKEAMEFPRTLREGLRRIAFGILGELPAVATLEDAADGHIDSVVVGDLVDTPCHITPGAWALWERYSKAVGFDMLKNGEVDESLYPNYGRFGTMQIKVAMLLAVCDAEKLPVVIEERHVLAGQVIVETWRASLHRARSRGRVTEERTKADDIKRALVKVGPEKWVNKRELLRSLSCAWSDIEETMENLLAEHSIESTVYQPARGKSSEAYRLAQ